MRGIPGTLPEDDELRTLLLEAELSGGITRLARTLRVGTLRLEREASRLGVSGRYVPRLGLPDDDTLRKDLASGRSMGELARSYGVASHHVRNQKRRLSLPRKPTEAEVNLLLFEEAASELAAVERQRDELARREAGLREELSRLLSLVEGKEKPLTLEAVLREAQSTGSLVVLPKAAKSARKASNLDLARLRDVLLLLRDPYAALRRGDPGTSPDGMRQLLVSKGLKLSCPLKDRNLLRTMGYTAVWQGREIILNLHVKGGVDPGNLIRVYFHWDDVAEVVVVGSMPDHLKIQSYA